MTRPNHRSACLVAALAACLCFTEPARAHDDGRLHVHVNGAAVHAADVVPSASWFARIPAPVFGVASLAVAATLLRRRARTERA